MMQRVLSRLNRLEKELALRAAARTNLSASLPLLAAFAHDYFASYFTHSPSKLHQWLIPTLSILHQNRGQRLCLIAPRGAAKSTWVSAPIYPLYAALHGLEKYIIIISDVQSGANKFLATIKAELEDNAALRQAYPQLCCPGTVWREEAIELRNGVRIEALGKGGKIRGRKHRQHRPSLIILDDPQNLDDAYSETQLEKDFHWLSADVLKAGEPRTNFLVIGTALHASCIVCKLEYTPGWLFRRFASLMSEPIQQHLWAQWRDILYRHDDPEHDQKAKQFYLGHQTEMDRGAELLWQERFPLETLMLKRFAEGERAFASEEQGIALPPGESEWPIEYFEHASFWFDEWPESLMLHGYALDPSKGHTDKAGDYQAFVRVGRDRAGILYVEAWLEKFDTKVLAEFLVELFRQNPAEFVALEANGFQELLRIPIQQACEQHQLKMPLVRMVNSVPKPVRIRRLTPYLAQRCIRFKRGSRGTQLLVQQLQMFRVPLAQGGHDDGPDALELCIRGLIMLEKAKTRR